MAPALKLMPTQNFVFWNFKMARPCENASLKTPIGGTATKCNKTCSPPHAFILDALFFCHLHVQEARSCVSQPKNACAFCFICHIWEPQTFGCCNTSYFLQCFVLTVLRNTEVHKLHWSTCGEVHTNSCFTGNFLAVTCAARMFQTVL